jgi:biopolymer transport protein ExbB
MHSTAYGLIMAIPALLMYAVLQNRANTLAEDMNQAALMVFNWLSFNYESVPHRKGRSFTNKGSDATI